MQKTIREHEFPSGDKLVFELSDGMYAEYGYQMYLQVFYAEKCEDGFYVTQIEYFCVTEADKANECFDQRLIAEHPSRASGLGVSLADIAMHNLRYLSKDMAEIHEITPIPPESNSFTWDRVRKGVKLTSHLTVMYREPAVEDQAPDHVILVNNKTGRRLYVNLSGFDQSLDDRMEEVHKDLKPSGHLETLADLRNFLNRLPSEELKHPVVIGSLDGQKFTKASRVIMTDLKNPLITDQHVMVLDK